MSAEGVKFVFARVHTTHALTGNFVAQRKHESACGTNDRRDPFDILVSRNLSTLSRSSSGTSTTSNLPTRQVQHTR